MNLTYEQEDYIIEEGEECRKQSMLTEKNTEKLIRVIPAGERPMESNVENVSRDEHIVISKEPHMLIIHATAIKDPDTLVLIARLAGAMKDQEG